MRPVVCALLLSGDPRLHEAVVAQERPPDAIVVVPERPAPGSDWIWVLDGTAIPRIDALSALQRAAERLGDGHRPVLLASRVIGPDGKLARDHVPLAPQDQTASAIETVSARVLRIRASSGGSVLVRPAHVPEPPAPGIAGMLPWTARILREADGFLVPESIADELAPPAKAGERMRVVRRMLAGDALASKEKLRLAAELPRWVRAR